MDRPTHIEALELVETLGYGRNSIVFRAEGRGGVYAVKLQQSDMDDPSVGIAFRREAAIAACFSHPALPRVMAVGESQGRAYLVREFVAGESLAERLRKRGGLDPNQVVDLARKLAGALGELHQNQLIHRDLRPEHIILEQGGGVRLVDFGLTTRMQAAVESLPTRPTDAFTYAPPEQTGTLRRPVDHRSDLYALGGLLFEALTGSPPFRGQDAAEVIRKHASIPAPRADEGLSSVSPTLTAIIQTLLQKDPDDRYQSSLSLWRDLQRLSQIDATVENEAVQRVERARRMLKHKSEPSYDDVYGTAPDIAGRRSEFGSINDVWREVVGGGGGIVLVEGEPGAGKSRFARNFRLDIEASGALVLFASCNRSERTPYAAFRRAFGRLSKQVADKGDVVRERLRTALEGTDSRAAQVAAELFTELDLQPRSLTGPEARHAETHLHETLADLFIRLAAGHAATLIQVDDAHWLDEASSRVLSLIARRLKAARILLLCTAKPGELSLRALGSSRSIKRISLNALSLDGVRELLDATLGGLSVADDVVRHIHTWSAGSPMAARQYTRFLLDMGLLVPWWGRWRIFDNGREPPRSTQEILAELTLPEDMQTLLARRVRELDAATRRVLTVAAAWGSKFSVSELATTLRGHDEADVHAALAEARRSHLIEPLRTPYARTRSFKLGGQEETFVWVHDQVHQTLTAHADEDEIRDVHQRIAELLDPELLPAATGPLLARDAYTLARHYSRGVRSLRPDRVFATNMAAAKAAIQREANDLAIQFIEAVDDLRSSQTSTEDAAVEELHGEALARAGRHEQSLIHYRRALGGHRSALDRAAIRARMAEILLWGRFETSRAVAEVEAGLQELGFPLHYGWRGFLRDVVGKWIVGRLMAITRVGFGGVSDDARTALKTVGRLHSVGGLCAYFDARSGLLHRMIGRSVFNANRLGPSEELLSNYIHHGVYLAVKGRPRASARATRRALNLVEKLDAPVLQIRVELHENVALHLLGETSRAQEAMTAFIAKNEQRLSVWDNLAACSDLGWNLLLRGHVREGWDALHTGLTRARVLDGGHRDQQASLVRRHPSILWASGALFILGRNAEAERLMRRAREFVEAGPIEDRYFRAALASQQLLVALETGQLGQAADSAIEDFEAAGIDERACPFYLRDFFVYAAYARLEQWEVALAEDRPRLMKRCRKALRRLKRTSTHPTLRAHYAAARAQYWRLRGKPKKALRLLHDAEILARKNNNIWTHFRIHRERGRLAKLAGMHPSGTYEAELALATAKEFGWRDRARRIEHEFGLSETGAESVSNLPPIGAGRLGTRRRARVTADAVRLQRHLEALLELSLSSSMVLHPDQQARVALDEIVRLLNAERAFLFLYSEEAGALELAAGRGNDSEDLHDLTGYASTVVEHVWTNLEPMVISGSEQGEWLGSESMVARGLRSIIAAPLMLRDRLLGVIYLDSRVARGIFTEDDVQILLAVANHIAIALEAARSAHLEVEYQVEKRERRLAETLRKATSRMTGTLEMGQVLMRLLESLSELVPHEAASVLLREADGFALVAGRGHPGEPPGSSSVLHINDVFLARVEETRRPIVLTDISQLDWFGTTDVPSSLAHPETLSLLGVPLLSADEVIGVLTLEHTEAGTYSEYDAEIAHTFASQAAIGLDNARLFAQVQRLAVLDGLTGTFNRRHFFEVAAREFTRALRYDKPLSMLMLDIDNFKKINDQLGHPVGDQVLRVVAKRIGESCRDVDVVGRYGGEEFAIVLPETPMKEGATLFAERLRAAIADEPIPSDRGPVPVTCSIGLANIRDPSETLDSLLDRADQALLRAKNSGKNRVELASE